MDWKCCTLICRHLYDSGIPCVNENVACSITECIRGRDVEQIKGRPVSRHGMVSFIG